MKITIVNHERNIKRYTRVDLDEFVAQLADGTYAPAGYHEPTRDVCFAAEWLKTDGQPKVNASMSVNVERSTDGKSFSQKASINLDSQKGVSTSY